MTAQENMKGGRRDVQVVALLPWSQRNHPVMPNTCQSLNELHFSDC